MELISVDVSQRQSERKPIVIAPIGDIQYNGKGSSTALDLLRDHISRCQELGAYYLLMGDVIDFMSPSNRQRLAAVSLYDTSISFIEDQALDLVQEIYDKALRPLTGRTIAVLQGHHFLTLRAGYTSDMKLAELLRAPFAGTSTFVRLRFIINKHFRGSVTIFASHGCGSGQKSFSMLNKLENIAPYFDADLFLIGHFSKMASSTLNRLSPRWGGSGAPDLVHRKIVLVGTGSFSKGYEVGAKQGGIPQGSYVETRLLAPAVLGAPLVYIRPNRHDKWDREAKKPRKEFSFDINVEI